MLLAHTQSFHTHTLPCICTSHTHTFTSHLHTHTPLTHTHTHLTHTLTTSHLHTYAPHTRTRSPRPSHVSHLAGAVNNRQDNSQAQASRGPREEAEPPLHGELYRGQCPARICASACRVVSMGWVRRYVILVIRFLYYIYFIILD